MKTLKARVENGRMKMDIPTKLPDGTVLELTLADPGDNLTAGERRELHRALEDSWAAAQRGEIIPAEEVMRKLRQKK